jgi:hypothetical protein
MDPTIGKSSTSDCRHLVAAETKLAAKAKVAAMSDREAFHHAQNLADAHTSRELTPQEELEFLKIWFGPDAEFLD